LEEGRIKINGKIPELGTKVSDEDLVEVDGKPIREPQEKPVYIAFNKPVGIVCTTDTNVKKQYCRLYQSSQKNFPDRKAG
jgi:23S rRNA pseudouridine2604 synthase